MTFATFLRLYDSVPTRKLDGYSAGRFDGMTPAEQARARAMPPDRALAEGDVALQAFREGRDVYTLYSFEDVAFHWQHAAGRVFRRFRGDRRRSEMDQTNRLFNDAQMGGRRVTEVDYDA